MHRVLVVTKGHPFEREPFFDVFDSMDHVAWTHVEQPAAQALFHPDRAEQWDVFVMYDMPGITFTGGDPPVVYAEPPADYREGVEALLEAGKGMVFLHHAIAGWPAWSDYGRIVGGRFHYQPADGLPDSGYRHDVTHRVDVLDRTHPICAGLGDGFDLTDELYLYPVDMNNVEPLLASRYDFVDENFWSADRAIRGRRNTREGWAHPPGSNLVAWVKHAGQSPIAYIQFGDGPVTYADPNYRRVVANAIGWAASKEAHEWARARARG